MSYETYESDKIWKNVKDHLPRKDGPLILIYTVLGFILIFNGIHEPSGNMIFDYSLITIGSIILFLLLAKPFISGYKPLPANCIADIALAPWCKEAKEELKVRINKSSNNLKFKDLKVLLKIQKRYDDNMTNKTNFVIKEEAIKKIMNDT